MKKHLGSVLHAIIFFTMLPYTVYAEGFSYNIHINNKSPYIKEHIILNFEVNQTDARKVTYFDFHIQKSPHYTFHRLDTVHRKVDRLSKDTFSYILYPLTSGSITIQTTLETKTTDKFTLAHSIADKTTDKRIETLNAMKPLPPIMLHVKPLPQKQIDWVGDFNLTTTVEKKELLAFEPSSLHFQLKGWGFTPNVTHLAEESQGYTLFKEEPTVKRLFSKRGIYNNIDYTVALSHTKDFTFEGKEIRLFNPHTEKITTLVVPTLQFSIQEAKLHEANLSTERGKLTPSIVNTVTLEPLLDFLGYLLVFVSGFVTALLYKKRQTTPNQSDTLLKEKIAATQTPKALLQLLLSTQDKRFFSTIEALETILYTHTEKQIFQTLKKSAMELT